MWVIGHNSEGISTQCNCAVNLSKADSLYVEDEDVYEDNNECITYWVVKAVGTRLESHIDGSTSHFEIEIAEFKTQKEAEKYLIDLVEKLNNKQTEIAGKSLV